MKSHWQLDPQIDFLNHGSFGATPTKVLKAQDAYREQLESQPIRFLAPERELESKLDVVRERVASLVNADPQDIAWVRNATDGVNAVCRSLKLDRGDELLVTNHAYNACANAMRYAAECSGATVRVVELPFPVRSSDEMVAAIRSSFTSRTRMLLVDHVTSPTGIVLPVNDIVAAAHQASVRVLVDGAHALGMLPIDLKQIDADYYTANHHKWLCAPKASGFLHVRRSLQHEIRPTVISHAANRMRPDRSRFLAEFDWQGTFDPTPLLAVSDAIDFLKDLYPGGMDQYMDSNHRLALTSRRMIADAMNVPLPAPDEMIGSLATIPIRNGPSATDGGVDLLQRQLYNEHQIEVPIFHWPDANSRWLRISCQAYNHLEQYRKLAQAIVTEGASFV